MEEAFAVRWYWRRIVNPETPIPRLPAEAVFSSVGGPVRRNDSSAEVPSLPRDANSPLTRGKRDYTDSSAFAFWLFFKSASSGFCEKPWIWPSLDCFCTWLTWANHEFSNLNVLKKSNQCRQMGIKT